MKLPETADPFEFFGASPDDDPTTLKRAYLKLARKYKPEHSPKEFQRIREMYERMLQAAAYQSFGRTDHAEESQSPPEETPPPALQEQLDRVWEMIEAGERARALEDLEALVTAHGRDPWLYVHGYRAHAACDDFEGALRWLERGLDRKISIVPVLAGRLSRSELIELAGTDVLRWEDLVRSNQPNDFSLGLLYLLRTQALLLAECTKVVTAEVMTPSFESAALENPLLSEARERVWTVLCMVEGSDRFFHYESNDEYDFRSACLHEDSEVVRRWLKVMPPALRFWTQVAPAIDIEFLKPQARAVLEEMRQQPRLVLGVLTAALRLRDWLPAIFFLRHPEYEWEQGSSFAERGRQVLNVARSLLMHRRKQAAWLFGGSLVIFLVTLFAFAPQNPSRGFGFVAFLAFLGFLSAAAGVAKSWIYRLYNAELRDTLFAKAAEAGAHPMAISYAFKGTVAYELLDPVAIVNEIIEKDYAFQIGTRMALECHEVLDYDPMRDTS